VFYIDFYDGQLWSSKVNTGLSLEECIRDAILLCEESLSVIMSIHCSLWYIMFGKIENRAIIGLVQELWHFCIDSTTEVTVCIGTYFSCIFSNPKFFKCWC